MLIRSVTATFLARGDTATPVKASLTAVAVNVAFKIVLMGSLAQVGLALATSIGAWVNLALVRVVRRRARACSCVDAELARAVARLAVAGLALALALWAARRPVRGDCLRTGRALKDEALLAALALIGAVVYGGIVLALYGRRLRALVSAQPAPARVRAVGRRADRRASQRDTAYRAAASVRGDGRPWAGGADGSAADFGAASSSALTGSTRPAPKSVGGPSLLALCGEDAADLGGRELRVALQQQRHDAADMRGRDRGAGGELVGALRRRHQDVDAGRRDRDVLAAVGAGEQLVVHVGRGDRDHVRVGGRIERRRFRPGIAGRRDQDQALVARRLERALERGIVRARRSSC